MRKQLPTGIGILVLLLALTFSMKGFAQGERLGQPAFNNPHADVAPNYNAGNHLPTPPPALWDIQFAYSSTDTAGGDAGMAAANYMFGEFVVSRWANDTLYRFATNGSLISEFVVPGLTGTRSLTSDGTYIYSANNTNTIYRIDPNTWQLSPPHITAATSFGVRHCTYDSTLNGGNGGFWVGNFNTDIESISMTGAVLSTIPAATHTLGGMYGSAFDNVSTGGPYLWIFHQGGVTGNQIQQLQLPGGTPTLITHDAWSDVGVQMGLNSGNSIAGGLFITDQIVPGQWTIGGMIQGDPVNTLFGYELNNPVLQAADAEVASNRSTEGYTRIPVDHVFAETFEANVANFGTDPLDTVFVDFEVWYGGGPVWTDQQMSFNLGSGSNTNMTSAAFTPSNGIGTYDVWAIASVGANQTDSIASNDSMLFSFEVTDTTFARDDNVPDGGNGYAVSSTSWAWALSNFTLTVDDTLSSISITLANPVDGDTTYAIVANTSGGAPIAMIASGTEIIIDAQTNDYTLLIPGGLPLTAGEYSFGCYEGANTTINLAQSNNVFTQGVNWFFTPTNGFVQSGIQTARFIRPNFGDPVAVSAEEALDAPFVEVYPNPTNDVFTVAFRDGYSSELTVRLVNQLGQEIAREVVDPSLKDRLDFNLEGQAAGIYFVRIEGAAKPIVKKILLSK